VSGMTVIDKSGREHHPCERCHRWNSVKVRRGLCDECRVDPCTEASRKFAAWVDAYQNRIRQQA